MMEDSIEREKATETFMQLLIQHVRDGIIADITMLLEKGPPGRQPDKNKVALHQWFQTLEERNQGYLKQVIQEAVEATLFSTLVILDGAAGGNPIEEAPSDYALYLQTYEDDSARRMNLPQTTTRLNPVYATDGLHDILLWMLQEQGKGTTS
jgi:hypothetical protein